MEREARWCKQKAPRVNWWLEARRRRRGGAQDEQRRGVEVSRVASPSKPEKRPRAFSPVLARPRPPGMAGPSEGSVADAAEKT
jgi:hypothetical protein